jgi:hypothetical protein
MTNADTAPAKKRKASSLVPTVDQLPLWSERMRGTPNALARSALFTCADKRKERRLFERTEIASIEGTRVLYTGRELRQDDLTVWLQVAHLARMHKLGDQVEVSARSLANAVGWGGSGKDITRLRECIGRMREGAVWVSFGDGSGFSGNLISSLEWSDAGSGDREKWKLYFDRKILALFQPDAYTLQDWELRKQLTPVDQWVYGFYATHANPYPYKIETLHRLSGSLTKDVNEYRKLLAKSLARLVEKNLIADYVFDTRTKTVRVIHRPRQPALVE